MRHCGSVILFLAVAPAFAHDPITTKLTWSSDVAPLIYRSCAGCHRPGGSAMALLTYRDARPWAKAIRDEVLERRMPPFDAVKGVGTFRDDLSLSQNELNLVVSWVEGGAPEGNPADLPAVPSTGPPAYPLYPGTPSLRVAGSTVLPHKLSIYGIVPEGALEAVACLPDGTVHRLLWVRDFRPRWNRAYLFRAPEALPRGTRILIYSPTQAGARLLTASPPAP